jgi:hypothetical protein
MTLSVGHDPKQVTGYRLDQLASAFDRVMNPRDWKAPIRSVILTAERELVEKAVLWFTSSVPAFEPAPGETDRLVVTAPGYRGGTAAVP